MVYSRDPRSQGMMGPRTQVLPIKLVFTFFSRDQCINLSNKAFGCVLAPEFILYVSLGPKTVNILQ